MTETTVNFGYGPRRIITHDGRPVIAFDFKAGQTIRVSENNDGDFMLEPIENRAMRRARAKKERKC